MWKRRSRSRTALASLLLACGVGTGCASSSQTKAAPVAEQGSRQGADTLAFTDVNVITLGQVPVLEHQTVVITGGRISRLGPRDGTPVPQGARVIDGAGRYLMPGMADMHVHLPQEASPAELERLLELYLVNGVTTVRAMRGGPTQLAVRDRIRAEGLVAPELYVGGPPVAEELTPERARALVEEQQRAGYDFLKPLGGFDAAAYEALVARAGELGFPVEGHVPAEVGIDRALAARQRTIEHVQGYAAAAKQGPEALEALARRTREAGSCNCPTLDFFAVEYEPDESKLLQRPGLDHAAVADLEAWRKHKREKAPPADREQRQQRLQRIVSALSGAGAPLLVGTDSPGEFRVPGFSYVEELQQLVRAGLTPAAALRAATRTAAECLGTQESAGAVAEGQRADLVLLERNPLEDVRHVARPAGVMVRGHWLPREELDRRLAAQSRREP